MSLYPVMINMDGAKVTVIGAGEVALRKVQDLCEAGAVVKVVAPEMLPEFKALKNVLGERIELVERKYAKGDLEGSILVFSTSDDEETNKAVFAEAERAKIFINAVDDPPNCSFFVPSFVRIGDFVMSISTSGASPAFAARMRRELEEYVPENVDELLNGLREMRMLLKNDLDFGELTVYDRGRLLSKIANDDGLLKLLADAVHDNSVKEFLTFMVQR